ncbi:23S rRNA pseudouridine(1911/1915/1917) synthase RluD [Acidithiobacillus acidisediminis]|uniref:23S rRNA pseudouridine(1911/1915/1917) synthase RluD n=1 Tax=Acidithiobacillus TaxID=119977 RepID=UPI00200D1C53|nr:23S rRNA pseudouridine(1911/1915/1917) synthase RluD [Acidithiobacillus sp. S30A2]MCL5051935.1 23S rRNA pseudouridine(1911/1915/1917) synthase RluD [Gammaproteobacteria bacterium]
MSGDTTEIALLLPEERGGERLDSLLAELLPQLSRSRIQELLQAGEIEIDGQHARPSLRVRGGESVRVLVPPREPEHWLAEPIPLRIVHEDAEILVVDKPAGMLTHPGAGHPQGTLANAVLAHCPANAHLPRAGIVHRLDKDTSGLLVVAKSEHARQDLIEQLAERSVHREYIALVQGAMTGGGRVEVPIGRHPQDRLRMTVRDDGRWARTDYRLLERFSRHTLLRLRLASGRTHQIRVHMRHLGHPLVGDPVYGGRRIVPPGLDPAALATWNEFRRQALHAWRLELEHPGDGEHCAWESPLPEDFEALLALLRRAPRA